MVRWEAQRALLPPPTAASHHAPGWTTTAGHDTAAPGTGER
jgi:hypothetical protein